MNKDQSPETPPSLEVRSDFLDFYSISKGGLLKLINEMQKLYDGETSKNKFVHFSITNEYQSLITPAYHKAIEFLEDSKKIIDIKFLFNVKQNNFIVKQLQINAGTTYLKYSLQNFINVSGTETKWVKGTQTQILEILKSDKNHNKFFHSNYFSLIVQISFVMLSLYLSFWSASKLKNIIRLQSSEIYIFFITILILSNIWTYLSDALFNLLRRRRPVTEILLKERSVTWEYIIWGIIITIVSGAIGNLLWKAIKLFKL